MNIYESYAQKIARTAGFKPATYSAGNLNDYVLSLPFGGLAWLERASDLKLLGEEIPLNKHMFETFFNMIATDRPLQTMTSPVMVDYEILKRFQYWGDWKTLEQYLQGLQLAPVLVFKHYMTHAKRNGDAIYGAVSDIRVVFNGPPYSYSG